ncbi:serine/arginine repetitive matrix protein 1 isoform X1 [Triticum aestivum]|uniref:serine/arginine repetitive matrix protein 1 isoform X1 n=1 Tax=Triticum aestivum TaxID=4565 RepID=UPI001D00BC74|nr:serine/arginine repetitive matrix protein 1-like isoform X1 [Triticum aestivum]
MEQATSISSSSREPDLCSYFSCDATEAREPEETGMEQVLADLQALKGLYGLLHRGPQPNENLNEASRDLLMKMLDNATQQTLLRQAKLLSGPLMSPALERKLSIQPGRRTSGNAEHRLKPIASPSPSVCASQMSRRLKPQASVRSRDARSVYDDHRRRERDGRLLARVDSGRSSRTAMPQLHQRTPEQRLSRLASNRSSRVAEPRLHPSTRPEQHLSRVASNRSSRVAEPRLRPSTRPEQHLSRVASNRSSRVAEPRLRPSTRPEQHLSRLASNRSSRVAEPRLRPSTPEQRLSRLASNRSSRVAEPRRGVSRGRAPRADRSDRHSRLRGSSGRGDRSSSSSSSSPERSSRRRSVSRAPSSHGRATVRGARAYGSSTRRYSGRQDSGLSMGVRSRRGSERAGRGAATPRRSSSSSGEAVTISSRFSPTRELAERRVHESEDTGERSLRRRQRKEGAVGGSTSMGWSSRRPRRALDPITSGSTYSSSSSAAASPSPSASPTAPTSTSAPSASSYSSSASASAPRRGSALPEHKFKEASSASRSRRRRERQERREGRLRMFKEKLALVFHHRHDHHHHHHIGGGRSGSPVPRRDRRSNNSNSPWSYLGGLGGMFHRSIGHAAKKTHDAKKNHDAKENHDAKKKTTSRTVVMVPAPAKKRGGGQAHSLFGALVKHKLGARKAPARAPTARAGTQSRMQVNHWWHLLRQQHGRAQRTGRARRRLGQGKAP